MTKKNEWFILALFVSTTIYLVGTSYPVQMGWWMCKDFVNPKLHEQTQEYFRLKSDGFLLQKTRSQVYEEVEIAANLLRQRNDPNVIPILIDRTHSWNWQIRQVAIDHLALWKDSRGNEVLMKIVRQGRKHRDYLDVVNALSATHFEPIYPEILKVAKDGLDNPYAVYMLSSFPEKPETLPALKMIAETDDHSYVRDNAKEEIRKITLGQAAAK